MKPNGPVGAPSATASTPAAGAGRDIAERPGGAEQAALARIDARQADAAVVGIVGVPLP